MKCLNTNELVTNNIATIYETQTSLQLNALCNLEVSKFMYKYDHSQLPATFINYFKFITNVHPHHTRQIKTRQFALPQARTNSGAKIIKFSGKKYGQKVL